MMVMKDSPTVTCKLTLHIIRNKLLLTRIHQSLEFTKVKYKHLISLVLMKACIGHILGLVKYSDLDSIRIPICGMRSGPQGNHVNALPLTQEQLPIIVDLVTELVNVRFIMERMESWSLATCVIIQHQ